ncbi:uncharacterized protein LOC144097012 [Amblyomma americanum]
MSTLLGAQWSLLFFIFLCATATTRHCGQLNIPSGKRFLDARSHFGKIMRDCSKELAKMAALTPKNNVGRRLSVICAVYKSCFDEVDQKVREGVQQKPQQMFLECLLSSVTNKSSPFFTELGDTEKLMNLTYEGLICFSQTGAMDLPMETLYDMAAITEWFMHSFG